MGPLNRTGRRGMSLFLALVVVAMLVLFAAVALNIASDEVDISSHDTDAAQALCAAESGLLHGQSALATDRNFVGRLSGTIEASLDTAETDLAVRYALYATDVRDEDGDGRPDALEATATYNGQTRALRARILSSDPIRIEERPREIRPR